MNIETNMVGWFEIYVSDMNRAMDFYKHVFQVEFSEMPVPNGKDMEMQAFPGDENQGKYGAPGALIKMEGYEPSGSGTIVYFSSEDCAVEEARIKEAGGKVITSKVSLGEYGFMVLFSDSEGNTLGIHSMN